MTGQERRDKILAIVEENGTAKVNDLAKQLLVSEKSIRRDLHDLENKGLLARFRGGAMRVDTIDVSTKQIKLELAEELPAEPIGKSTDVTPERETVQKIEQPRVVKTSRPDWIVKAIEKNRPGTIVEPPPALQEEPPKDKEKKRPPKEAEEKRASKDVEEKRPPKEAEDRRPPKDIKDRKPARGKDKRLQSSDNIAKHPPSDQIPEGEKPKKDLNVIEVGAKIHTEALAELRKLTDVEPGKVMPIPLDESTWQQASETPEPLPRKRDEERIPRERPKRRDKPVKPVEPIEEIRATEPKRPTQQKRVPEPRERKLADAREDKKRKADKPTKSREKIREQEEEAPKNVSKGRKILDVVHITVALICFIGGTALAIFILQDNRGQEQRGGLDESLRHTMVTHGELNFYVPENWNVLDGGGGDTVIRIRGDQGDIIGAVTISTHEGNLGSSLEANFDDISARIHGLASDFQSDVIQFGNTPTRRHSYTDSTGEIHASLNTFLIPSGDRIKYIQLRKPLDGFNQDLLTQFNEIVRSMNFQPSQFTRE